MEGHDPGGASAPVGAAFAMWAAERARMRPVLMVTGALLLLVTGLAGVTPLRLAPPESVGTPTVVAGVEEPATCARHEVTVTATKLR